MPKGSLIKELNKTEKANLKKAKKLFSEEIKFYIHSLDVLNESATEISNQFKAKKIQGNVTRDWAVLTISNKIMGTAKAYLDLISKGYHFDSQILLRCMWENVWVMDWLFKKENNVQEWIGDIHGNLKPSDIRKQLGLPEFTKYYYGFLSQHVHSSSSAISHFGNFWSRGSKYNFREMEESDFIKIEHLEASLINKHSFSPDVETYALNI